MARITGIGGIFFRARDPDALNAWYQTHLGITQPDVAVWMQDAGPTVFSPFKASTDYFPADKQWMLNLRDGSYGTFARIHDPEGTPIELWQPPPGS